MRMPRVRLTRRTTSTTLLFLILLLTYLLLPHSHHRPRPTISQKEYDQLSAATPLELLRRYNELRASYLSSTADVASFLKAPATFATGDPTFPSDPSAYFRRLRSFTESHFVSSPKWVQEGIHASLDSIEHRLPPRQDALPHKVWTTSRMAPPKTFDLWAKLLPLRLPEHLLEKLIPKGHNIPWPLQAAETGAKWDTRIVDDDGMDRLMSDWTGERVGRGIKEGQWGVWGKLDFGVLRADLFRYMALLCEGGIYADSDTSASHYVRMGSLAQHTAHHPSLCMGSRCGRLYPARSRSSRNNTGAAPTWDEIGSEKQFEPSGSRRNCQCYASAVSSSG